MLSIWSHLKFCRLVVRFDPPPQQANIFKSGSTMAFPLVAQDYGNSTTTGHPVSG